MKYWRGYLVGAIFAAMTWGLVEFAKSHWELVDMVYPYVTRLIQNYLVEWSSGISICLWQLLLMAAGVLLLASIVLMIILKWNPIQWFGWVVAAAAIAAFLNTALVGLNNYAGPIAQDIRLNVTDYNLAELEAAGTFYRDKANELSQQVARNPDGTVKYPEFQVLAQQAGEGFETQTYDRFNSVFAGSTAPVKELGWDDLFAGRGITGITVGITGEAAANPQTPAVALPFVMCREMAKRMCITDPQDAAFAAFLACDANTAVEFQYSGYLMAYRYCYETVNSLDTATARSSAIRLAQGENSRVKADLEAYNASFAALKNDNYATEEDTTGAQRSHVVDLLVSWHIQEYVLPQMVEDEVLFDPLDETQVDMTGLPHVE